MFINFFQFDNFYIQFYPNNKQNNNVMLYCQKVNIPGWSSDRVITDNKAPRFRDGYQSNKIRYSQLSTSFIETEDLFIYRFFDEYKEAIIEDSSILSTIILYVTSNKKNIMLKFQFDGVTVDSVSDYDLLSTESQEQYMINNINFSYSTRKYEVINNTLKYQEVMSMIIKTGLNDMESLPKRNQKIIELRKNKIESIIEI